MSVKIKFAESFKNIVKKCADNGNHLGGGNPNSKILMVGKEAALDDPELWYINNARYWLSQIESPDLNFIRQQKFPVGHTWTKYQKLHDYIFPEYSTGLHINFEERFFTTEMSDNPAKKTGEAQKREDFKVLLQNRKNTFFREDFIQSFPVVVLACSDYIKNVDNVREIDEIFGVTYSGDKRGKYVDYSRGNSFYLHYSTDENESKLVIHTRQLSNNVDDKMLQDMGKVIKEHLRRTNNL